MTFQQFKTLLNNSFGNKWVYGAIPKSITKINDYVVVQLIDELVYKADNVIYSTSPRYQLSYYNKKGESNIDSFFIDNKLIYASKRQTYLIEDEVYQTIYEIYL